MDTKETQAMNRLLKKLSALRATLPDDERALLDGFIVSPKAPDEVQAHMIPTGGGGGGAPDEVRAHMIPTGGEGGGAPDEVRAHMIPTGGEGGGAPDEVQAHAIPATPGAPRPYIPIVIWDAEKGVYRLA